MYSRVLNRLLADLDQALFVASVFLAGARFGVWVNRPRITTADHDMLVRDSLPEGS